MKVTLVVQQTGTMDEFRRKFHDETGVILPLFMAVAMLFKDCRRADFVWTFGSYMLEIKKDYPIYKLYKIEHELSTPNISVGASRTWRHPDMVDPGNRITDFQENKKE